MYTKQMIAVIAVLLIIAGGLFFLIKKKSRVSEDIGSTPIPPSIVDETPVPLKAGYTPYDSDSYGISFQFPTGWGIDNERSGREKSGQDLVFSNPKGAQYEGMVVNPSSQTVEEWAASFAKEDVKKVSKVTIDGKVGLEVDDAKTPGKLIAVRVNGKLYVFSSQGPLFDSGIMELIRFSRN